MMRGGPIVVLQPGAMREQGKQAAVKNIQAGKSVADIVRTTLGPKSMLKMLLDPMGGIVLTNDGNAILREVDVGHPAAKSIIELSRAQDEEVGDGTTSVVVLAGELLAVAENFLSKNLLHPCVIVAGYIKALDDCLEIMEAIAHPLDVTDDKKLQAVVDACLATKFSSHWGDKIAKLALQAVKQITVDKPGSARKEIDIKRHVRVEKIPGGEFDECRVLDGVMINKDITHAKMRRYIKNPRIVLLDCPLEYKKGESQTNVEITKEEDFEALLKQEELEVRKMCRNIIDIGCDVLVTEKGVSDLAAHFLMKAGISCIRRIKKMDNNRLAKVAGGTIVNRTEELMKGDVGTACGLFTVDKIGDDYFSYFVECKDPKACTVILRGASKDVLNEVERNFHDALNVSRNILLEARLLPGGGATEMELAARLSDRANGIDGLQQWSYKAVASALEVIPRTIAENCGADVVRTVTSLRSLHAAGKSPNIGIDGNTGKLVDTIEHNIWDTFAVKQQVIKTSIEAAAMILRIDDVVSGVGKKKEAGGPQAAPEDPETFGDQRDG
eukprot:Lankesteria_metandrocarpae@DN1969_c0_g1_i1.p1